MAYSAPIRRSASVVKLAPQAPLFLSLCVVGLTLGIRYTVALDPHVNAVNAYTKALCHLRRRMAAINHLLDWRNLEFIRVPRSTHNDSFA